MALSYWQFRWQLAAAGSRWWANGHQTGKFCHVPVWLTRRSSILKDIPYPVHHAWLPGQPILVPLRAKYVHNLGGWIIGSRTPSCFRSTHHIVKRVDIGLSEARNGTHVLTLQGEKKKIRRMICMHVAEARERVSDAATSGSRL